MLKSFGDSFIFGTDLADDGRDQPIPTFSNLTWPALIAQDRGWEYQCYAKGGAGNLMILDRSLKHILSPESDFYIIGWTWAVRYDYNCSEQDWPGGRYYHEFNRYEWSTLAPNSTGEVPEFYFQRLQSDYRDVLTSLLYINTVIELLKQRRAQFIMTCMDETLFDKAYAQAPAVAQLQRQVKPYISWFEGRNFLDWSINRGFDVSSTSHPLETAHRAAADLILSHYGDFVRQ